MQEIKQLVYRENLKELETEDVMPLGFCIVHRGFDHLSRTMNEKLFDKQLVMLIAANYPNAYYNFYKKIPRDMKAVFGYCSGCAKEVVFNPDFKPTSGPLALRLG